MSSFRPVPPGCACLVLLALVAGAISVWVLSCSWSCLVSCPARVRFWLPVSVSFCSASRVSTSSSKSNGHRLQNRALLARKPRNVDALAAMVLGIPEWLFTVLDARRVYSRLLPTHALVMPESTSCFFNGFHIFTLCVPGARVFTGKCDTVAPCRRA